MYSYAMHMSMIFKLRALSFIKLTPNKLKVAYVKANQRKKCILWDNGIEREIYIYIKLFGNRK